MSRLIECFTFGSCGLHASQRLLRGHGFLAHPFDQFGIPGVPYALSSGAAAQLHEFCVSELSPPEMVRMLAYGPRMPSDGERRTYREMYRRSVEAASSGDEAEIALIELSTPIEPIIGNAIVNLNRIRRYIKDPLYGTGIDPKLVSRWGAALSNASADLLERADALLRNWPADFEDGGLARFGVENLSVRQLSVDDMVRDLQRLQDRLGKPMALQLYHFKYMPDGRAIEWPAGFKAQQIEVARRLGMPTFDLAPVVARLGSKRLIREDMSHWRPEAWPLQAELTYDFLAGVLGRPSFKTHAESEDIRCAARAAYPELADATNPLRSAATPASPPAFEPTPPSAVPNGPPPVAKQVFATTRPIKDSEPDPPSDRKSDPLADRLNRELIALHGERLKDVSPEAGGFEARYRRLAERGTLVGARESEILKLIGSELPLYEVYAVMRAGVGELAFLLGASGRRVMAFEPNSHGRSAIETGAAHLTSIGLIEPGALTLFATLTPEYALYGRVLGIGLKNGYVGAQGTEAAHWAGMARFEALLIDPKRFLRTCDGPVEQGSAMERLRSLGFDGRRDFLEDGLSWFHRSRRRAIKA